MDFDFPLIPLLPLPITLVPAVTFAALENNQNQIQQAFASSVSIGLSKSSTGIAGRSAFSTSSLSSLTSAGPSAPSATLSDQGRLGAIVDALGEASAKAQELPTSITQTLRLAKNPTQRVYILRTGLDSGEDQWLNQLEIGSPLMMESTHKSALDLNGAHNPGSDSSRAHLSGEDESRRSQRSRSEEKGVYVAGMLKIGEKKLFIVDKSGTMHEQEVCCVLDFYVDESCQRRGFGKCLFEYMLGVEGMEPNQIAYDRPSPKLYRFLSKYFHLDRHLPQPNQFAIFEGFKLLDCGETIAVDNDDSLPLGRANIPTIPGHTQLSPDGSAGARGNKVLSASRALQSSVIFGYTSALDSQIHNAQTAQQQQQPSRRISSAFTSSITL